MILFIFFLLFGCIGEKADIKVVDGDTFWYGKEKIRLAYVDTPELHSNHSPCEYFNEVEERCIRNESCLRRFAYLAKEWLENQSITRVERKGKDRYGRTLAIVFGEKGEINLLLLEYGYARTYRVKGIPEKYIDAEREAMKKRIGIWSCN